MARQQAREPRGRPWRKLKNNGYWAMSNEQKATYKKISLLSTKRQLTQLSPARTKSLKTNYVDKDKFQYDGLYDTHQKFLDIRPAPRRR